MKRVVLLILLLFWPLLGWTGSSSLLEPGDVLAIEMPGEKGFSTPFAINREGIIHLPEVGDLKVAGLSLDDATTQIRQQLSSIYKNLSLLTVKLKEKRMILTVLGFVNKPGDVNLPGNANVQTAISGAGGFTPGAELDRLQVRRGDHVTEFNYKAYLDTGNPALIPKIQTLDTIFIPSSKLIGNIALNVDAKSLSEISTASVGAQNNIVRVLGAVGKPGSYQWSDKLSLMDLLTEAGGPVEKADLTHISIIPGHGGLPLEFNLKQFIEEGGDLSSIPHIKAGYTIMVPILPDLEGKSLWLNQPSDSSIYIFGQVGKPGRYGFNENMTFLDILSAADGPTADADMHNVRIIHRDTSRPFVEKVNLSRYFETGDEYMLPHLLPGDSIYIPSNVNGNWLDKSNQSTVRVLGAVAKPGRYMFDDSMNILDLLAEAGGPTSTAWIKRIVVVNMSCCQNQARSFNLEKFAKTGNIQMLPVVRAGDTIFVPDTSTSPWKIFMDTLKDVFYILATLQLLSGTNSSSGSGTGFLGGL